MSDQDDNKKPDSNDPFNFFKLSIDGDDDGSKKRPNKTPRFPFLAIIVVMIGIMILLNMLMVPRTNNIIDFSDFRKHIENGDIVRVEIGSNYYKGYTKEAAAAAKNQNRTYSLNSLLKSQQQIEGTVYRTVGVFTSEFEKLLIDSGVDYEIEEQRSGTLLYVLLNILPFVVLIGVSVWMFRKMSGGISGSIFGNGGGRAKAVDEGKVKTRFNDVAGVDEAKEELVEVVDFLKQPKKYTEIGGKIPKGVLLVGPPGTGKTLLARAVAGEAGVPFFRISGSDFVEMFVGVGASRVRDLFRTAREKAPCIIFIDELDAIGKSRVNNLGGNDEREQTLNQLLVEMDGFDNEKGLIILAATNRPDILDPALLRPGRFDRQVAVDKPDVKGREAILHIHAKNVKVSDDVDFSNLALATSGLAGADLANIVNEAALLAVRNGRKLVVMSDFDEAIEKTLIGLQRKSRVVKEKERHIVAYHETGHALVAAFTPGSDPVHKITIIPRGVGALGYTLHRSEDETFLHSEKELLAQVDSLLGGRAAEEVVFGEISTGASNDISRATDILKSMITDYGMSKRFKNVTLGKSGRGYGGPQEPALVREFSEETQNYIDEEIASLMQERYTHVLELLNAHRDLLEYVAKRLLEKETVDGKEFEEIIKAEGHYTELASEAGKREDEERFINASALKPPVLSSKEQNSPEPEAKEENEVVEKKSARRTTRVSKAKDDTLTKEAPAKRTRTKAKKEED